MLSLKKKPSSTGLALHAATVAFTTSRSFTSHLRKLFNLKYRGRYRRAGLLFAFDAFLLVFVGALLVLNTVLVLHPAFGPPTGLDLTFRANELIAARPMPIEAVIRSTDGRIHEDVRLTWSLPSWVEVVHAKPALTKDHTALLGTISPSEEKRVRLTVIIRALPDTDVPFTFRLQEGVGLRMASGGESRPVVKSALYAEPVMPIHGVEPGGSIPLRVTNESTLPAPAVIIRLTATEGAPQSRLEENGEHRIGTLAPGEERIVFLDVDPTTRASRIVLGWEVQDASRAVSAHSLVLESVDPVDVAVREPLRSAGTSASAGYTSLTDAMILVFHPLLATESGHAYRTYELPKGEGTVQIPLRDVDETRLTSWSVVPFETREGKTVFGKRTVGTFSRTFPFRAGAYYYTQSGEQIGVGPLPPRVGEQTFYWIVWSLGPTDTDLRNVALQAELGNGVRATGEFASQVPGTFSADGASVRWAIPSLPKTGGEEAAFAFEISYTPNEKDRGTVPVLIKASSASAVETHSDLTVHAEAGPQDTNLEFDTRAKNTGTVE